MSVNPLSQHLYTFKYFNKYYKEFMNCEFLGSSKGVAQHLAVKNINLIDKKHIETPYKLTDFEYLRVDNTIINIDKTYKTKSGLRVSIHSINLNSTTIHNKVIGNIYFKNSRGEEKKNGEHFLWSLQGRSKFVGINPLDLIEVL